MHILQFQIQMRLIYAIDIKINKQNEEKKKYRTENYLIFHMINREQNTLHHKFTQHYLSKVVQMT